MSKRDDDPDRALGEARTELGVGAAGASPRDTQVPDDSATDRTASLKPFKPTLEAPDIPGYKITDVLGEGGMGTVYAALQEAPHRKVAIKILHRGSQTAYVRFQTEAEVMARLDHPGIARVLEAGVADGRAFLVMDFVDGKTLDDYVVSAPLRERLELFAQICDAVHHAHVKGVIHRDLKPSNVMVREDKRALVLDFGVARLADDSTPGPTRAGELIGTPLYMSPEQARLRPDEVDSRTDVYTLGVILYELASDELPYEVPRGLPLPVLTVLICDEPPVPLGKRVPALRGDLEAIAAKALSKDPRDRYQSVAALAEDIRRYLDQLPVSVRMPGPLERARRFVRRRPLVAAAIAGSGVSVLAFAGIVTALWLEARGARRTAEEAQTRTEVARSALEARTTELTLRQARAALMRDPTDALAWLATLPSGAHVDARLAWMIADEARARGVSRDVLHGHADEVHWTEGMGGAAFVSGGYDGRVIVWSPAPRTILTLGKKRVHVARPSPDGTRIAVGGDDGTLIVIGRDGTAREDLGTLRGDVQELAWSPDGRWLVAGSDQGHVQLFAGGRGEPRILGAPLAGVTSVSITGEVVVAGYTDGRVRTWKIADGTGTGTETQAKAEVVGVWTDGARTVFVSDDGVVHTPTGDVATGVRLKRAAFAPDGSWSVVGGVGGDVVRVAGTMVTKLHVHRAQVRSLAVSSDGRWIASGGDDGSLVLHDATTARQLALRGHTGRVRHLAFAGNTLFSSDSEGVVRRWDLADLGTNVLTTSGSEALRFAVSGEHVVAVDSSGLVTRWSLVGGVREELGRVEGRVSDLVIAGPRVIALTADGHVAVFGGDAVALPETLPSSPRAVALVGDELVIGTTTSRLQLVRGGASTLLPAHEGGTDAIAVAPDGRSFASGGQDRKIRVWSRSATGWHTIAELDGPTGDTHFLAYTPDGSRIVTAGNDGSVFAWRVKDGVVDPGTRALVAQHTGAVTALVVSDDAVVSAGRDLAIARSTWDGGTLRRLVATPVTTLAFGPTGTVFGITRGGAALRWDGRSEPVVEIDHGVVSAAAIDASRWILGFEDGAIVLVGLGPVSLGDLQARIAALTSYRITSD